MYFTLNYPVSFVCKREKPDGKAGQCVCFPETSVCNSWWLQSSQIRGLIRIYCTLLCLKAGVFSTDGKSLGWFLFASPVKRICIVAWTPLDVQIYIRGKFVKRWTVAACRGERSMLAFSRRFSNEVRQRNICPGWRFFNTICMYLSNKFFLQDSWKVKIVVWRHFTVTSSRSRVRYCLIHVFTFKPAFNISCDLCHTHILCVS